ncbi:MAG: DUF4838 domain-containing protein [Clostridia bacterium]|nr:DUF4838 domain-containing protein [Clostridia bacterium]
MTIGDMRGETARAGERTPLTLAQEGSSGYVIVCGKRSGDPEYTAAEKLQTYLERISGVKLPVVSDDTPPAEKEIVVGRTNREDGVISLDRGGFTEETACYFTEGDRLVIAGGEPRGTLYAAYEFLKRELGCRWYTDTLTVIPPADAVRISPAARFLYTSRLEYRMTDWISTKDAEFCLANHINTQSCTADGALGGAVRYTGGFGHTLTSAFCCAKKYFADHPEYFALYHGRRTPKQLCLTNPDVLSLVIDEVRGLLEAHPDAQIVSLTQGDTLRSFCQCKNCRAVDRANGSHAGTMISFVNAVAAAFAQDFPNLKFDTFAYRYTRTPPKKVRPRDNVIVRLCSIECCFAHPLDTPRDPLNMRFCRDIRRWSEICKNLYIWDYTTNYWQYLGPFPNFGVMQPNMRFFVSHNARGVYEEGNYQAAECDAEFAGLRCYLLSRLLYDPDCDLDAETDGFLRAYYGAGWKNIREYIDLTTARTGTKGRHMIIYHVMTDGAVLSLSKAQVARCDEWWQTAEALCANDTEREHVQRSALSWRYWKACNRRGEFSRTGNRRGWKKEHERLLADYRRFGVTRLTEISKLAEQPDLRKPPSCWGDRPRKGF